RNPAVESPARTWRHRSRLLLEPRPSCPPSRRPASRDTGAAGDVRSAHATAAEPTAWRRTAPRSMTSRFADVRSWRCPQLRGQGPRPRPHAYAQLLDRPSRPPREAYTGHAPLKATSAAAVGFGCARSGPTEWSSHQTGEETTTSPSLGRQPLRSAA